MPVGHHIKYGSGVSLPKETHSSVSNHGCKEASKWQLSNWGSNLEMVVGWLNTHFNSKIKLNISFQAFVVLSTIWKAKYYRVGML